MRLATQKHRYAGAFFMGQALEIHPDDLKLAINGRECYQRPASGFIGVQTVWTLCFQTLSSYLEMQ